MKNNLVNELNTVYVRTGKYPSLLKMSAGTQARVLYDTYGSDCVLAYNMKSIFGYTISIDNMIPSGKIIAVYSESNTELPDAGGLILHSVLYKNIFI